MGQHLKTWAIVFFKINVTFENVFTQNIWPTVLIKQEEEVHGKQRELDRLKDEEKELMTDIKKSEREIQRIEDDLKVVQELEEEVSQRPSTSKSFIQIDMSV